MRRSAPSVLFLLLVLSAASVAPAAAPPEAACRASKLGAAGKYASAAIRCLSKPALDGTAADPECATKAQTKFSSAFAKAEEKAGAPCNGLASTTGDLADETVAGVAAAIPVPPGGGLCASLSLKSAAKYAGAVLKAWSRFAAKGDAAARDESLAKASSALENALAKAEAKDGCVTTGQLAATRDAVDDPFAAITACIGSTATCVETEDEAAAGETVTTDPLGTGPTTETEVVSSVETPNAGTVVLRVTEPTEEPPSGYLILGRAVDVTAPAASAATPLVLTFVIDASVLPSDPNLVEITRNGVLVPDCTGAPGQADPDPCLASRTVLGTGDLELVALSSQASQWVPLTVDPVCPTSMHWTLRADAPGSDRATELDMGWTGEGHDVDLPDGFPLRFHLDCGSATSPNCGACAVTGFEPAPGNCRCGSSSTVCDEPGVADMDDCGGATCNCYSSAPVPLFENGTSTCTLLRGNADATGTWDPGLGSGEITFSDRRLIYLADELVSRPCPACVGDATANDGVRGGVCDGGPSDGSPCDAHGSDPTWPAIGGGWTSLDCMPNQALNVSGAGLGFVHTQTTGTSTIANALDCGGSGDDCDLGTCVVDGSGEGACDVDTDSYCDGFVEEDGRGIFPCVNDSMCDSTFVGDAGSCTLVVPRPCFGSSVTGTGAASSSNPVTVASQCVAASTSAAINSVYGLPGPSRLRIEWDATYWH